MEAAAKTDRREALLDAAIEVVAAQGLRGLTHRAVEAQAELPHGSTTYYFGTRHDLLTALMAHMAFRASSALEPVARQLTLRLADRSQPIDIDSISDAMIQWIDAEAGMELARYELQIAGARDDELKAIMSESCAVFRRLCEPIVIACGSTNPTRDAEILQSAVDGWMFHRLTDVNPDDETVRRGVRLILGAIAND